MGQAGYGVFFAENSPRNYAAHVPEDERQSVSRGELRRVLHALLQRRAGERLLVVMDSEYVFKGITEWSVKWQRHSWRTASGEVGHRDLWEQILWERERAGECVQLRWTPSHLGVSENQGADALAEVGRRQHPHNVSALPKRRRVLQWNELGLEEMSSADEQSGSDLDSGASSGESGSDPVTEVSPGDMWLTDSSESVASEFSTDVSDTRRVRARVAQQP